MFRLSCAARFCQMRTYNFSDEQSKLAKSNYVVSFHKFPADVDQRKAWIEAAKQLDWKPADNSCLCSLHFRDDCFDQDNQLFDHAVPTIFFTDFRAYIKSIVKNINLEVDLESEESDANEDILSKSLKNLSPVVSDTDEVVEYELAVSDDDFEIECEEITLTEEEEISSEQPALKSISDRDLVNMNSKSLGKSVVISEPATTESLTVKKNNISLKKGVLIDIEKQSNESEQKVSITDAKDKKVNDSSSKAYTTVPIEVKNLKTKQVPSEHSETVKKLFSMIKSGSFNKFSVMQPASKNLVYQLLNIVKLANSQNAPSNNADGSIPGTYIITTKQENEDSNAKQKIVSMETTEIVSMITNTIESIKDGSFQKTEDLSIICGSPAIFLIRNVIVKNFDRNMNSVYVIRTENLLPHLYQLSSKIGQHSKSSSSVTDEHKTLSTSHSDSSLLPLNTTHLKSETIKLPVSTSVSSTAAKLTVNPQISKSSPISQMPNSPLISPDVHTKSQTVNVPSQNTKSLDSSAIHTEKGNVKSLSNITTPSTSSNVKPLRLDVVPTLKTQPIKTFVSPQKSIMQQNAASRNAQSNMKQHLTKVTTPVSTTPNDTSHNMTNSNLNLKTNSLIVNISTPSSVTNSSTVESSNQNVNLNVSSTTTNATPSKMCGIETADVLHSVGLQRNTFSKTSTYHPVITLEDSPPKEILNDTVSLKRKFEERNNNDSKSNSELEPESKRRINDIAILEKQKTEIQNLERNIVKKESEIIALRKKIQKLKKRYNAVKNPVDAKTDEQLVEEILKKYLDQDAVQFFVGQMKVSGKTYTQFRWTEEDKLFALGLLYKNPVEYHILFQRFTLPSDKTLSKFVARIKKAEQDKR